MPQGYQIAEIGVKRRNFCLVANYRFTQDAEKFVQDAGAAYLGKIDPDDKVENVTCREDHCRNCQMIPLPPCPSRRF